jgi:hypothetical protein
MSTPNKEVQSLKFIKRVTVILVGSVTVLLLFNFLLLFKVVELQRTLDLNLPPLIDGAAEVYNLECLMGLRSKKECSEHP